MHLLTELQITVGVSNAITTGHDCLSTLEMIRSVRTKDFMSSLRNAAVKRSWMGRRRLKNIGLLIVCAGCTILKHKCKHVPNSVQSSEVMPVLSTFKLLPSLSMLPVGTMS